MIPRSPHDSRPTGPLALPSRAANPAASACRAEVYSADLPVCGPRSRNKAADLKVRATAPLKGGRYSLLLGSLAALLAASIASTAAAEELLLKNGQKVVGTIVGYEGDMFRVETVYGFALIRKDSVESINFSAGLKRDSARKPDKDAASLPSNRAGAIQEPPDAKAESSKKTNAAATPPPTPAKPAARAVTAPAPPSHPLDEPFPESLQEHVDGITYINDSFHFAMFKPPGWKVYEEVPKETGSAIVAIGTEDEQTLLFIDRQVWSGTPDFKSDSAEQKLRATYQEYHKLSESPVQVGGQPALRRVFNGVIDGVEWHGISVHLAQGNTVFGIIGLTSAETYQFQQALFNKIINSFHFLPPASPPTAASTAAGKP